MSSWQMTHNPFLFLFATIPTNSCNLKTCFAFGFGSTSSLLTAKLSWEINWALSRESRDQCVEQDSQALNVQCDLITICPVGKYAEEYEEYLSVESRDERVEGKGFRPIRL